MKNAFKFHANAFIQFFFNNICYNNIIKQYLDKKYFPTTFVVVCKKNGRACKKKSRACKKKTIPQQTLFKNIFHLNIV